MGRNTAASKRGRNKMPEPQVRSPTVDYDVDALDENPIKGRRRAADGVPEVPSGTPDPADCVGALAAVSRDEHPGAPETKAKLADSPGGSLRSDGLEKADKRFPDSDARASLEEIDRRVSLFKSDSMRSDGLEKLRRASEHMEEILVESREATLHPEKASLTTGHAHAGKEPSLLTAFVSGLINFLLMFGMCCAFGMIMFDEVNAKWQSLGVKMSLATSAFCGLIVAAFSRIPVAIAGPDLNPIVFLGAFVATMAPAIAASVGLSYPGQDEFTCGRRLEDEPFDLTAAAQAFSARLLGGSGCAGPEGNFCKEGSDSYDAAACSEYNQQLVTTTIFAVAFSSALFGLILFLAGRFNLTRYVNFVPSSISEAFLSCVGYKVFAYALKFCKYDPKQFLPAGIIGVLLYFLKAMHIGNPAVVIPALLLTPLAIFHVLVACGVLFDDLDHARAEKIMFPYVDNSDFWIVWTEGIYDGSEWKFQHINVKAWAKTIPDLVTMLIVVMIDCLLKVKNTENKLPIVPEMTYESQLFGICNAVMFACGSPCGYMQLKFNVINFGILGNATDRRGGMIYAAMCALCFFWTTAPFNYLPRFFLSMLLFFAGAGFVAENLYGSSKYMSFKEWLEVVGILLVFIISGQLIYAVAVGILFTATFFCLKYASIPVLARQPERGGSITSYARRDPLIRVAVRHIADSWFFVLPVKGYVFFASAKTLVETVKSRLHSTSKLTVSLYAPPASSNGASRSMGNWTQPSGHTSSTLGLELRNCNDGKSLLVTGITDGGLISEWNSRNPNEAIEPGDLIVNVSPGTASSTLNRTRSFEAMHRSMSQAVSSPWKRLTALKLASSASCYDLRHQLEQGGHLRISLVRESSRPYKRVRFVIFDCSMLDGMDCSACAILRKLITRANNEGTAFLWTNLAPSVMKSLQDRGIITDPASCFNLLDHAVYKIEETILQYRQEKVEQWLQVHPALRIRHKQIRLARSFEPFMHVFETDAERRGCPWLYCTRQRIRRFRTILWGPDQDEQCLFLIHSGAVGVYASLPGEGEAPLDGSPLDSWLPSAMYEHGWFVNRKFVLQGQSQDYGVAIHDGEVLSWNAEQWCKMSRQRPLMASAILKAVMRQQLREAEERDLRGTSSASLQGGGAKHSANASFPAHLPPEARLPILALGSVRALDALGLWSAPGPSGARPAAAAQLPRAIREDLSRAFRLYCEESHGGPRLPEERLHEALMFAGIFGVELSEQTRSLNHDEFIILGHEASIVQLSETQRDRLLQLFRQYDLDSSGTLDRHELPQMFIKELSIPASVVDSISRDVDSGDGCIDQDGFLWIVSRLIRAHENDFMMWKVLCELTGSSESTADAELTVEMLKERSSFSASDEEWEEMCWAMDLSAASSWAHEDPGIDFSELVTMVIAQDRPGQLLPPLDNECLAWGQWLPWKRSESDSLAEGVISEVKGMVLDRRSGGLSDLNDRRMSWGCVDTALDNVGDRESDVSPVSPGLFPGVAAKPDEEALPDRLQRLRSLLEDPSSSSEAYCVSVCIGGLIVLSILNNVAAALTDWGMSVDWSSPFWIVDVILAAMFTIEFTLRAVAGGVVGPRSLVKFLLTMRNLLDFCAIMPTYLDLITSNSGLGHLSVLRAFRLLRLAQLARLGRLSGEFALAAPVTTVLVVIWGIYLKESVGQDASTC